MSRKIPRRDQAKRRDILAAPPGSLKLRDLPTAPYAVEVSSWTDEGQTRLGLVERDKRLHRLVQRLIDG